MNEPTDVRPDWDADLHRLNAGAFEPDYIRATVLVERALHSLAAKRGAAAREALVRIVSEATS